MTESVGKVLSLKPKPLKEAVANYLRGAILRGALKPGERVDQAALAAQLGISRQPVREALLIVEADGLLKHAPNRGHYVPALTDRDIRDYYRVYGMIVGLAAFHAVERITDADLDRLSEIVRRQTDDPLSAEERQDLNIEFHSVINRAGCGEVLRALIKRMAKTIPQEYTALLPPVDGSEPGGAEEASDEHAAILGALRNKDGRRAAKLVEEHLLRRGEYFLHAVRQASIGSVGAEHDE